MRMLLSVDNISSWDRVHNISFSTCMNFSYALVGPPNYDCTVLDSRDFKLRSCTHTLKLRLSLFCFMQDAPTSQKIEQDY